MCIDIFRKREENKNVNMIIKNYITYKYKFKHFHKFPLESVII